MSLVVVAADDQAFDLCALLVDRTELRARFLAEVGQFRLKAGQPRFNRAESQ